MLTRKPTLKVRVADGALPDSTAHYVCMDCGDDMPKGRRRITCRHCGMRVCGWCYNHIHGLVVQREDDLAPCAVKL